MFTKQLQWAAQQCKKTLNKDAPEETREQEFRNVDTVSVHVAPGGAGVSQPGVNGAAQPVLGENEENDDNDGGSDHVDIVKICLLYTSPSPRDP